MAHPVVTKLRFARSEFVRGFDGVSDDDARRRLGSMNSLSWIVCHLGWHEQLSWLKRAQGTVVVPELFEHGAYGTPASTPPLTDAWAWWRAVVEASDPYLDGLTTDALQAFPVVHGKPHVQSIGTMIQRVTYHYWFHTGESQAIRQMLGHQDLGEFVGDIHTEAPYVPE